MPVHGTFSRLLTALTLATLLVASPAAGGVAPGKLNVNAASAADLARVPGLDAQIAARIVARRIVIPFRSLDELLEVPGITKLTMISASDYLEVGPPPATTPSAPPAARKVDLNKASFAELLLLPEMTPRGAKAIVDYRERNGGFKAVDELGKVPGIDKRSLITLLDRVTVMAPGAGGGPGETITLGDEPWGGSWTTKLDGTPPPAPSPTPRPLAAGEKIDVNTATREELERLPDIGPVMAQRILDHRKQNGPFASVDELVDVRGIGQTRLTSLRPWVTASGGPRPPEPRPTSTPRPVPTKAVAAAKTPARTPAPVPATPEPARTAERAPIPKPAITPDGRVNINVASVEELLTLPRMTREAAQEIVQYRARNGPFRDPHAIVEVPSIGEAAYARLRDRIVAD